MPWPPDSLRSAARELVRRPALSAAVVLSLTLPFASTVAVFAAAESLVLDALPFREPQRLVVLGLDNRPQGQPRDRLAWVDVVDWRERATTLELTAYHPALTTLTGEGEPELVRGAGVTASFFTVLGVEPALGRTWSDEEGQPGGAPVVVLGHRLWQRRFGGDPGVLGRRILLDTSPALVLGVMPSGFGFPEEAELWMPPSLLADEYLRTARDARLFEVVGRLADGAGIEAARQELAAALGEAARLHPEVYRDHAVRIEPLADALLGDTRRVLGLLAVAAVLLVAIAASNAVHLLLARAVERAHDLALRSALGAGRGHVARQLLVEGTLLGAVAGGLGVLLAAAGLKLIGARFSHLLPAAGGPGIGLVEVVFAVALATVVGLLLGAVGLARARRLDLGSVLREGGPTGVVNPRGGPLRRLLVATEVTLATTLGISGLLLLSSAQRLSATDAGFEPERLLTFQVSLPYAAYPEQQHKADFFTRAIERLEAVPGVVSAAASSSLAFDQEPTRMPFAVEGVPRGTGEDAFHVVQEAVTEGYFETLGVALTAGRALDAGDHAGAPAVALINRAAAERYFAGRDPLGRRIAYWDPLYGEDPPEEVIAWRTVVGVVADSRRRGLEGPVLPEVFVPFGQSVRRTMRFAIRTAGDPVALAPDARRAIWSLDDQLPVTDVRSQRQILADASAGRRLLTFLVGVFAVVGVLLAAIGTYAVTSFAVRRATREIGVRLAVGADRRDVLRHVLLHHGLAPAAGLLAGLGGAWLAARSLTAYLFGVDPGEPTVFAAGLALLGVLVLLACALPAGRAARLDPVLALRNQ